MATTAETNPPPLSLDPIPAPAKDSSYSQILKATAWVGGSQVINIAIGMIRTKVIAMLLGPAGFGLTGLYGSIASLTQSVAGLGVNSSGVRQIAEAVGSGDSQRVARTVAVLRWISVALGLLGALFLIVFAVPISRVTFGSEQRVVGVALLSLVVCFNLISAGQGALIQGMRRISDMAKMGVFGAVFGTMAAIPLVYLYREDGVVLSLVATALVTLLTSWWYSRKVGVKFPKVTFSQVRKESAGFIKLGLAFMVSNMMMMASAYLIRIIVMHKGGLEATGLYQAAWTLGGMYVGMILQSMGADFYPRLTAVVNDHRTCNQLVNEQAHISVLLAGPGVLATLAFAPFVISIFYAAKFGESVEVLRWLCLGVAMRVISWPMGFIIMALGKQNLIILCEVLWSVVHLGLAWILVSIYGVDGAGMAFFGSYLFHIGLTAVIAKRATGFVWTAQNRVAILWYVILISTVFFGSRMLPQRISLVLGCGVVLIASIYSMRVIASLSGVPDRWKRYAVAIGFGH